MSGIKQVNEFNTVTQIRKIAQDALAPLVTKIQEQVNKVAKQSAQMRKGLQRIKNLENTQIFIQANLRQISKSIADIKSEIQALKSQDKKNSLLCLNGIEGLKDQISAMKKSDKRKEQRIKQAIEKGNQVSKRFEQLQASTSLAIQKIKERLTEVYTQTLQKVKDSQKDKQQTMRVIEGTLRKLSSQRELQQQKFKILDLYVFQRDETRNKIQLCMQRLRETPTLQQLMTMQQQVDESMRSIEKADSVINQMPNRKEVLQMKRTIQYVEQKVEDFARILELELEVQAIKRQLEEDKTQVKGSHVHIQTVLREIEHRIQQFKNRRSQESLQQLKTTNDKFNFIENKITKFSEDFRQQLQKTSQNTISQLYNITKQFPERENHLKKQLVQQISAISHQVYSRCQKIEQLGANLEYQLSTFGHKISKMKSDNELHQQNIQKELKILHRNRVQVDCRFTSLGNILSGFFQMFTLSNSISLFQNSHGLDQKLVYVTYNDGIVCEIDPQTSGDFLMYRRKQVTSFEMRKALMTGIIQFMDKIITSQPYLGWNHQRPSDFFKEHIYQHYSIYMQKSVKKQLNRASQQRLPAEPQIRLKVFVQNQQRVSLAAQPFNTGTQTQLLTSKQFKQREKQADRSKQKEYLNHDNQHLMPRSISHIKQSSLINQTEVLIQSRGGPRTINHPSKKGDKEKSYQIKMRKSEKQRYQRVYSSRSGRYSRLSYIG